jgi:hypothetical protein
MIEEEKARRFIKRNTKGDASETGLIRFVTPILMKEYDGPIEVKNNENALEEIRSMYPILQNNDETPTEIPFSSTIKFNMIIRDMNPD